MYSRKELSKSFEMNSRKELSKVSKLTQGISVQKLEIELKEEKNELREAGNEF